MNEKNSDMEQAVKPSKSRLKRESAALQDLAAELAALSSRQLQSLDLPETLFNAIKEVSDMPPKGARKRMLKYISGLLRAMDAEPVKEQLAKLRQQSVHSAREHHKIEHWRERLIKQGHTALTELLNAYPCADRQQLRQLIRNAQKELQQQKPPHFSRQLFRYLRDLFANQQENIR